ncbi:hypothetical protein Tco_0086023 [Tanacetum coccineum]
MVKESLEDVVLAKESSQPQCSYEAVATLTEFELKKIMIDKMDKSESYPAALEHRECYEGLKKSYDLDKTIFSTYGKVYSLKRSRKDKDKDEDPSAGSDRGLKKRKTSKDAEPTKEKPEFEVAELDMPQVQEENPGKDDEEPKDKTPQQGQNQSWLLTLASSAEKPSKTFDELMSTLIDFSAFIMNGLKINNLTQETLLGPAFRLLKGTHSNYAELEYDFEECYKALSEKLDWENPEGGDYPFDLTKPLPLVIKSAHKGDDVYDFTIALRMLSRSLVIQKRVEDLQLGVESYQKKINVTRPENTKPGIRKRDPYTLYQDPQGFIYVDNNGRNKLMRSDELYKFNDRTLTELRTSLDDITKNI